MITQNSFHKYNQPIIIDEVDIKKKMLLSSKESYGNKGAF